MRARAPFWSQEEVFPIIAETITAICRSKGQGGWAEHIEITAALESDPRIQSIVENERQRRGETEKWKKRMVTNMKQWFGQQWTEFEQRRIPKSSPLHRMAEEFHRHFEREPEPRRILDITIPGGRGAPWRYRLK